MRDQDSIGDPSHQYIPNLWFKMKKEGTLFTSVIDRNRQFHMAAVGCINTGKMFPLDQEVDCPTIFQYASKAYHWPKEKLWAIGEWDNQSFYETPEYPADTAPCRLTTLSVDPPPELRAILTEQEKLFFERYKKIEEGPFFFWPTWDSLSEMEQRMMMRVFEAYKPKLVHYVIGVMESAHFDSYGRYVISLKRADEMISQIWQMVKSDPFYRDNTYLIVTPDHSRNAYHLDHFENPPENPSRVWLYIYGSHVKRDTVIKDPIDHVDVFPTISAILGLDTGKTQGRVLRECFSEDFFKKGRP